MSIRRRGAAILTTCIALAAIGAGATPAAAQVTGVTATLSSQTPYATPQKPDVSIEVTARNDGPTPVDNPSLQATVWSQITTIGAYDAALRGDPAASTQIANPTQAFDGLLQPGQSRRFPLHFKMVADPISRTQSYVYPLEIVLLSGAEPVATLRSAVVFVVRTPLHPIAVSTRITFDEPLLLQPNGVFSGPQLEQDVAPTGRIGAAVSALRDVLAGTRGPHLDVVVSPVLLLQLERMRGGYSVNDGGAVRTVATGEDGSAAASRVLAALRSIVANPEVQLSAWPLGAPTLPSLLAHLDRDVGPQLARGRGVVKRVLGHNAAPGVMYPPRSAITEDAINVAAEAGAHVLLLDPAAVPPQEEAQGFAPAAVRLLPSSDNTTGPISAVVTDEGVQSLLTSPAAAANPVLAAQQALGQLAAIWLEQPGVPRGFAVAAPDLASENGATASALIRRVASAPFLDPVTATGLANEFPPPQTAAAIGAVDRREFSSSYAAAIKHSHRLVDSYRSILVSPSPVPEELTTRLLLLEGSQFLDDPIAGQAGIQAVDDDVDAFLGGIRPVAARLVTLTSRTGRIPVQITNTTGRPVRVDVRLVSPHLTVGGEQTRELTLARPQLTMTFDVELKTTGEFPVQVQVLAPSGRPISDTTIAVRSTAYSRIALFITLAAALALFALWARRYLPSRHRTT